MWFLTPLSARTLAVAECSLADVLRHLCVSTNEINSCHRTGQQPIDDKLVARSAVKTPSKRLASFRS